MTIDPKKPPEQPYATICKTGGASEFAHGGQWDFATLQIEIYAKDGKIPGPGGDIKSDGIDDKTLLNLHSIVQGAMAKRNLI